MSFISKISMSLFADDGTICRRGRNAEFTLKQAQKAFISVEEWGKCLKA